MAGNRYRQNFVWQASKRRAGFLAVELFLLCGMLGFSLPIARWPEKQSSRAGYEKFGWEPIYWGLIGLVAIMLMIAILSGLISLAGTIDDSFAGEGRRAVPLRRLIQRLLIFVGAAGLLLLVASLLPIPTTVPWIPLVVLLALLPVALLFWRRIINLHSRFQKSLEKAVESEKTGLTLSTAGSDGDTFESWQVKLSEVILPEMSVHAGASIQQTNLRSEFGCSIVEIERQGRVLSNPRSDFLLFAEDRLLLFGAPGQVEKAVLFLSEEGRDTPRDSDFDDTTLEVIKVPPESTRTGQPLASLRVFNVTGVQLMGIQRNGERKLSPGGGEVLHVGDRLLALGNQRELRDFPSWLCEACWEPT